MADLIIYDSLGAPEDTASDTGSLHAKVAYIVDTVIPTLQKPRHAVLGSFSTNVTTAYQTALSVSGKGSLKFLGYWLNNEYAATDSIKLTIDDVVMGNGYFRVGEQAPRFMVPDARFFLNYNNPVPSLFIDGLPLYNGNGTVITGYGNGFIDISFTTNLKIEVKHIDNNLGQVTWIYDIE